MADKEAKDKSDKGFFSDPSNIFNNKTIGHHYKIIPKAYQNDFRKLSIIKEYVTLQVEKVKEAIINFEDFNPLLIFIYQCNDCLDIYPIFLQLSFEEFNLFYKKKLFAKGLDAVEEAICDICKEDMELVSVIFFVIATLNEKERPKSSKILFVKMFNVQGEEHFIFYKIIKDKQGVNFKKINISLDSEVIKDDIKFYP